MHRRLNEAAAHANMLRKLIENRKSSDRPTKHLHEMLRKAEARRHATN